MPYSQNSEYWAGVISDLLTREVKGLSELNLAERNDVIGLFKGYGVKIAKQYVPKNVADWRKGDENIELSAKKRPLHVPKQKWPLVSKINAVLLDMGLEWTYADGISRKMFGIDHPEWCDTDQLYKVTQALVYHQRRERNHAKRA